MTWLSGFVVVVSGVWLIGLAAARETREEVDAYWEAMIACLRDPQGYAVWHVPLITGVKP